MTPIATAGGLFVAYALASLAWAPTINPFAVANLLGCVGAFFCAAWVSQRTVWLGFVLTVALAFPVAQYGLTANVLGSFTAAALAGALTFGWLPLMLILGVETALTGSRGAILAATAVLLIHFFRRFPTFCVVGFVLAMVAIIAIRPGTETILQRLGIWQDTADHLSLFGSGLGSFATSYATWPIHTNMTLLIPTHTYNDYLELLFELGIGILPLLAFLALCLDRSGPKLPIAAFLLLGATFFPFSIPPLGWLASFSLGALVLQPRRFLWPVGV